MVEIRPNIEALGANTKASHQYENVDLGRQRLKYKCFNTANYNKKLLVSKAKRNETLFPLLRKRVCYVLRHFIVCTPPPFLSAGGGGGRGGRFNLQPNFQNGGGA